MVSKRHDVDFNYFKKANKAYKLQSNLSTLAQQCNYAGTVELLTNDMCILMHTY